jgi:competence protein ComEC
MKSKLFKALVLLLLLTLLGGASGTASSIEESAFTAYFIDVGQADSALILCGAQSMLIDGGNVADSDLVYTFLKKHGVEHLNYIIATHAHEDHIGGLAGALNFATVDKAYCPVTNYNSKAFENFIKYLEKQNANITIPHVGDVISLGKASVQFLAPVRTYQDTNNTSIVVKITYGKTSFLFTGDAERESEADILAAGSNLESTVLKVGHHGSDTSTSYPFLREIMPRYAVISVGKGNAYGHPHDNTLSRLRDAGVIVYRTDIHGDITAVSDGVSVFFQTQKQVGAQMPIRPERSETIDVIEKPVPSRNINPALTNETSYIGNVRSKIFHFSWCSALGRMSPRNRIELLNRQEAMNQGFRACGICRP